jgi:UDP-4-amino-4-deoxy-L-arabinose formyltransferase/UDP-glucuronic acid dehydrogenase (UDP-4-keto-hexauronic acid decarboxylating)
MKFGVVGRTHLLIASARRVVASGHELTVVATAAPSPEYQAGIDEFAALAREAGCPFFVAGRLNDEHADRLTQSGAEAVISINWPTVMSPRVLDAPRFGVLNAHAGDLPRYRGNACPNWAILAGEDRVTIAIHRMVAELDAGPVLLKRHLPLTPDTYIADVYRFLEQALPDMFAEVIDTLARGDASFTSQPSDPAVALRCYPRQPDDGEIVWSQPAEAIGRLVRASAEPFAGAYTFLEGRQVVVWRARAERLSSPAVGVPGQVVEIRVNGEVAVLTGDGVLVVGEASVGSERDRPSRWLRSTRQRLGLNHSSEITQLRERIAALERRLDATPERSR